MERENRLITSKENPHRTAVSGEFVFGCVADISLQSFS